MELRYDVRLIRLYVKPHSLRCNIDVRPEFDCSEYSTSYSKVPIGSPLIEYPSSSSIKVAVQDHIITATTANETEVLIIQLDAIPVPSP